MIHEDSFLPVFLFLQALALLQRSCSFLPAPDDHEAFTH
jgi:hypothetical protein